MRIGIDVFELDKTKLFTGVSNYICNILQQLEKIDRENEYFLYSNREINFSISSPKWHKKIYSGLIGGSHSVWMNTILVRQLKEDNIDLFWQPAGAFLPIFMPARIKTILTIHDMILYYYPKTMEWGNRFISRLFFSSSYSKADAIITVSNFTAKSIQELFLALSNRKKTAVIYHGVDKERFRPMDKNKSQDFIREKFNINSDYILFIGATGPRKNLAALIKAFSSLARYGKKPDHWLIIVGKKGKDESNIHSLLSKFDLSKEYVKFLGYVDVEDLAYLYSATTTLIMPSLYEGFGLPILEAMACGCPVITSNISSMPEVAGDAAILVDPYNIEGLTNVMFEIISDKRLQEDMREKGFKNIERFSWEKAARETLNLFNDL